MFFYSPKETDIKWIGRCCHLSFGSTRWNVVLSEVAPALQRWLEAPRGWLRVQPSALHTCLQELANHFNSTLNLSLDITERFLSVCHCNTSPCFCSWVLSSNFWVASSWLQWSFSFGSCHSQIKQIGLRRKSHPFPLSSVPGSSSRFISTERIFFNMFFTFNHVLDSHFQGIYPKFSLTKKISLWGISPGISFVNELRALCFPSP